jgi:ABC-type transport system involved in multi-copper enzyme maturation permease subunit
MIGRIKERLVDGVRLLHLSCRIVAGRKYWIAPLLPLLWIVFQIVWLSIGAYDSDFVPADAQNTLIGFPLTLMGIGFGVRIIAGEMDFRTLEIAYTVPGGAHRVWLAKLAAASLLLVASAAILAPAAITLAGPYPPGALYGAFQAAVFYMVLAMAFSALFKGEAVGALLTVIVLLVNFVLHQGLPVLSPFFNPESLNQFDAADVLAMSVRNHIGYLLIIAAVMALSFGRAESREKILGG